MYNKKSQVAVEFMAMTAVAVFAMIIFIGMLFYNIERINREKSDTLFRDFAYSVQNEFNLAARVNDGYYRQFFIPDKVDGHNFSIGIQDHELIISSQKQNYYASLPNATINSQLAKGLNFINKTNGTIYLN